jgi:glutamate-ammonia-ligase adenylyltransferase
VAAALARPAAFSRLFAALGHSRALGRHAARGAWRDVLALDDADLARPLDAATVARGARARLDAGAEIRVALRANHHALALRVLIREALLNRPLEETGAEISALADGALAVALQHTLAEFETRRQWHAPENFRFCVIAMGKLGAAELNYCSDIDLMFVFDGDGPRGLSGRQFAVKIAERLISLLDEVTEDGLVFRVDTRLRPEGKRGSLARSVQGTLDYYHSFGSTWERQALIKARPCAGDIALGAGMLQTLQPWVYRKYLTVEEIRQIQELKRTIERRTDERAETFLDVKTGFGGIRDIEFVTQFLQLLNGGRLPDLRRGATLDALAALARHGVLKESEAGDLSRAYRFLRGVEHRLQLWEGAQTHTLPQDAAELSRIGRALGFGGPRRLDPARQLLSGLRAHTLRSRGLMVRLFAGLFGRPAPEESALVLDPDLPPDRAREILGRYRFSDISGAHAAIRELANESSENRLYAPRARKYLASMMPALLEFAAGSPDPDATLRNFERIVANLGAKTMLFELVAEDPRALAIFGGIAAQSDWLSAILARRPGLVDEFIDSLQTISALDRARLEHELADRAAGADTAPEAASWQRDAELLRIGTLDITGRTPLPHTLRELCVLAEVLLAFAVRHALKREAAREPELLVADPAEHLCVIGMGKLGAGALHYASDLDLVFAYQPGAVEPAAEGAFYNRVVRRVLDMLTVGTDRGKLYDVDLRLRPHGSKGVLCASLDELERYLQSGAQFWERIAACRARVLAPQSPAGRRAEELLAAFCYAGSDAAAVREMRERLLAGAPRNDLKRAAGGTLDVEFLLAHLQLARGADIAALRRPDVLEALRACRDHDLLDARSHDALVEAYLFLRQCINRMQLCDGTPHDTLPDGPALEVFAQRMGYRAGGGQSAAGQLTAELDWHRAAARRAFERFVV